MTSWCVLLEIKEFHLHVKIASDSNEEGSYLQDETILSILTHYELTND